MPDPWFTEAEVEAAARNICWAEIGDARISPPTDAATVLYVDANWHRHVYQARAALSAIPDPRAKFHKLQEEYSALESERNELVRGLDVAYASGKTEGFEAAMQAAITACTVRRSAEQIMRDERRRERDDEMANAHGDRAQMLTEMMGVIARRLDAAKTAISAETARRWPEADDLLDWIADLKPEPKP